MPHTKPTHFNSECGVLVPQNIQRPMWLPSPALINSVDLIPDEPCVSQISTDHTNKNELPRKNLYLLDSAHMYFDKIRHGYAHAGSLSKMVSTMNVSQL